MFIKFVKIIYKIILHYSLNIFYHGDRKIKQIALTFDDGPNKNYTPKILDILKEFNIKATFFLTAKEIEAYPELMKRIMHENHCIGNHTYSHRLINSYSFWMKELIDASAVLEKYTGKKIKIFRPPDGKLLIPIYLAAKKLKLKLILWTIDSKDWKKAGNELILNNLNIKNIKNSDIILFHDDNQYTVDTMPVILNQLKENGYKFVTIDEMLNQ